MAVDTHIFRVANRTGLAPGRTPLEVEQGLIANTPRQYLKDAHHWLLLHGRYVCTARTPACPSCLIRDLCEYPHKTPTEAGAPKGEARGGRHPLPCARAGAPDPDVAVRRRRVASRLRRRYLEAWRKFSARELLEPLEASSPP